MAADVVDDMRSTASVGADGMATHVAGPAGNAADSAEAFEGIDTTLLLATAAVVIVILLLTYRSPVLWLLPVISAATALFSAEAVIYALARYADLTVNAQSAGILTVLVFGAGTDYALLLVARYREELRRHNDRHEAMAVALHRAGPAIIASAGTVVLGMLCLVIAEMNSTRGLGPVAAIGVAVGLLAMVTLLPALLVIVGRWIFWPVRPQHGTAEPTTTGGWARTATVIARRPRLVWVGTALVLGAMSLGILGLDAKGLTTAESFRGTPDSVTGEDVLAEHFASDAGSPVQIISTATAVEAVRDAAIGIEGVADLQDPVVQGEFAYLEASLSDPPDSGAAYATIERLRATVHAHPGHQEDVVVDAEGDEEHEYEKRQGAVSGVDTEDVLEHPGADTERGAEGQHHGGDEQERRDNGAQQQCEHNEDDREDQRNHQVVVRSGGLLDVEIDCCVAADERIRP